MWLSQDPSVGAFNVTAAYDMRSNPTIFSMHHLIRANETPQLVQIDGHEASE